MSVQAIAHVLEHSRAEHAARLVLIALANHANGDGGDSFPSIPTIAREARLGESTVRGALERLKELGEIVELPEASRYRTRSFRLILTPAESAPPQILHPRRIEHGTPQNLAADPAGSAPEPSIQQPSVEPSGEDARKRASLPAGDIRRVFDEWVTATERDAAKTQLTRDRRRCIEKALRSHGLDDCLAAVRNIGADAWARGANDRGQRFDDIKHALGTAERLERWRDQTPRTAPLTPGGKRPASARDDLAYLDDNLVDADGATEHLEAA